MFNVHFFYSHGDFLHALLCNENKNSVRVPPLSLRGYEGWATCGQNTLTGSPQASLTIHIFIFCSIFVSCLGFSDLGFSFLWTRVPQLAALALHSSPKVGIIVLGFFGLLRWMNLMSCTLEFHSGPAYWVRQLSFTNFVRSHDSSIGCACWEDILDPNLLKK